MWRLRESRSAKYITIILFTIFFTVMIVLLSGLQVFGGNQYLDWYDTTLDEKGVILIILFVVLGIPAFVIILNEFLKKYKNQLRGRY